MKKLIQTICRLNDQLSDILQKLRDYLFGVKEDDNGDDYDEEYIGPWNLDYDPWNLDYNPWNLDYDEANWLNRLGDWLYALFYGKD